MPKILQPRPFLICFEARNMTRKNGRVWAIKQGSRWRMAREVSILVPTLTVYKGATAPQPKAYLTGVGVVRCVKRGQIIVTP